MVNDEDWDERLDTLLERLEDIEAESVDYLDLDKDYHEAIMGITRDEFGRFINKEQDTEPKDIDWDESAVTSIRRMVAGKGFYRSGWYQDKEGKLYHYDGAIWDVIPEVKVVNLEYLG